MSGLKLNRDELVVLLYEVDTMLQEGFLEGLMVLIIIQLQVIVVQKMKM